MCCFLCREAMRCFFHFLTCNSMNFVNSKQNLKQISSTMKSFYMSFLKLFSSLYLFFSLLFLSLPPSFPFIYFSFGRTFTLFIWPYQFPSLSLTFSFSSSSTTFRYIYFSFGRTAYCLKPFLFGLTIFTFYYFSSLSLPLSLFPFLPHLSMY